MFLLIYQSRQQHVLFSLSLFLSLTLLSSASIMHPSSEYKMSQVQPRIAIRCISTHSICIYTCSSSTSQFTNMHLMLTYTLPCIDKRCAHGWSRYAKMEIQFNIIDNLSVRYVPGHIPTTSVPFLRVLILIFIIEIRWSRDKTKQNRAATTAEFSKVRKKKLNNRKSHENRERNAVMRKIMIFSLILYGLRRLVEWNKKKNTEDDESFFLSSLSSIFSLRFLPFYGVNFVKKLELLFFFCFCDTFLRALGWSWHWRGACWICPTQQ